LSCEFFNGIGPFCNECEAGGTQNTGAIAYLFLQSIGSEKGPSSVNS
jgi:hypothetical protein